jgi:hypothetical protein
MSETTINYVSDNILDEEEKDKVQYWQEKQITLGDILVADENRAHATAS